MAGQHAQEHLPQLQQTALPWGGEGGSSLRSPPENTRLGRGWEKTRKSPANLLSSRDPPATRLVLPAHWRCDKGLRWEGAGRLQPCMERVHRCLRAPSKYQSQNPPGCYLGSLVQCVPRESVMDRERERGRRAQWLRRQTTPGSRLCPSRPTCTAGQVPLPLCLSLLICRVSWKVTPVSSGYCDDQMTSYMSSA